jgi:AcrR family transcriptional regulator
VSRTPTRKRGDAEETRRRVLDAVVATVVDVGYYKASSNEIARHAGVTWGTIQHLFGSREQLMLDVVNDFGSELAVGFANSPIEGETLEERLDSVFEVLAGHYLHDRYLVQVQILLDLSANPKMSAHGRRAIRRNNGQVFNSLARPLLARALGELSVERDLAVYAFMTMRGYLVSLSIARHIAEFPAETVLRLAIADGDEDRPADDTARMRDLVVRGVASMLREEGTKRGYDVDAAVQRLPPRDETE